MELSTFLGAPLGIIRGARPFARVAQPALEKQLTLTFPGGGQYRWVLGQTVFTAGAEAGERILRLAITDGTTAVYTQAMSGHIGESEAATVSLVNSSSPTAPALANGVLTFGVPYVVFQAGWTLGLEAVGIKAVDRFSALNYYAEQVDNGPYGEPVGVHPPSIEDILGEPLHAA